MIRTALRGMVKVTHTPMFSATLSLSVLDSRVLERGTNVKLGTALHGPRDWVQPEAPSEEGWSRQSDQECGRAQGSARAETFNEGRLISETPASAPEPVTVLKRIRGH